MALTELAIPPGQTQGQIMQATPTGPGANLSQNGPIFHGGLLRQPGPGMGFGGLGGYLGGGQHPGFGNNPPPLMSIDGIHHRVPLPMPIRPPNFIGIQPQPPLMQLPDYSSQFENFGKTLGGFGEQLTGFCDQMTGYQDALGSFNEQVGGMGKQFETISNRLDSVDKGLGSLGNQIANIENMQKAQPQEVQPQPQPQRPAFNPFNPFGFGGLGSLFGRRY